VALPSDVDSSRAKATFKEGVLELSIPKVEKAKRRSVTID
jgi:HSP20 family protein